MSPYEQNFEDTVVLLDNDFDNLPTQKETSRSDAWFGFFNNLIGTTGDVLSSWFNSKRPGNTYYYTQEKTDNGKMFLLVGGAALVLILFLKKKK